jgi:hypothetical protein
MAWKVVAANDEVAGTGFGRRNVLEGGGSLNENAE